MSLYLSWISKYKHMDPEPSGILSENESYLMHTEFEIGVCNTT